ncbi:MAG: hypothetical protein ACYTFY_05450 [Planctomycetota bacterium]
MDISKYKKVIGKIIIGGTLLCLSNAAIGADRVAQLVSGRPLSEKVVAETKVTYYADRDLKNEDGSFQMTQYDADILFPIFNDEKNVWRADVDITNIDVNTDARLELDDNEPFPNSLYDIGAGVSYRHTFENKWQAGFYARVGSASDKVFSGYDQMEGSATAFLKVPHKEYNAWMLFVDARNNRKNPVLPGFAYLLVLGETSYFVLGAPLCSFHFEPFEKLALDFEYSLEGAVDATATYDLNEKLDIFASYDSQKQAFYREGRKDKEDGLFMYERKVSLGLKYELNEKISIGAEAGYAQNRLIFEGENYDQRDKNRIDVEGGTFGSVNVDVKF